MFTLVLGLNALFNSISLHKPKNKTKTQYLLRQTYVPVPFEKNVALIFLVHAFFRTSSCCCSQVILTPLKNLQGFSMNLMHIVPCNRNDLDLKFKILIKY